MKKQIKISGLMILGIILLLQTSGVANPLQSANFYKPGELPGDYIGEFVCIQANGKSGLTITLTEGDDGNLNAVCKFHPIKSNPNIPVGSFTMDVTINEKEITFIAKEWISQPENYNKFNVEGVWDPKNNTISGKINNEYFSLKKFLMPEATENPGDDS